MEGYQILNSTSPVMNLLNGKSQEGRCYRLPIRCCLAGRGNRHPSAGTSKSLYPFA
jgi:hypothetical protein